MIKYRLMCLLVGVSLSPAFAAEPVTIGDWSISERSGADGTMCVVQQLKGIHRISVAAGEKGPNEGRLGIFFAKPIIEGQSGELENVAVAIDKRSWTVHARWASAGAGTYVTLPITEGHSEMLRHLSRGSKLTARILDTDYTIDLSGSFAAIGAYRECLAQHDIKL